MGDFNVVNVDIDFKPNFWWPFRRKKKLDKISANILFIDDSECPVVENLQKAGWAVRKINDIINIQDENIKRADIIFVDYKGVGDKLSEKEQGISVIRAIKNAYRDKKRVILYSAYGRFKLSVDMRVADNQMSKNSETSEFISMIESELSKIK
jgi:hypothetical protein